MRRGQFIVEKDAKVLASLLPEIQALADSEKEALGFLPAKAFEEAVVRRRLIAAISEQNGVRSFAGYLLYSGVFPNAKVQQIAAASAFRNKGVASALMKALVSELERTGFLSIRADVASNLSVALAFYSKNGFECIRERVGGIARGRTILVHSRQLETDSLFTFTRMQQSPATDFSFRHRSPGEVPVFVFDLNVYFDLVRQRDQSDNARRLFGEALGHTIRLAVADEFVTELRRTSNSPAADPVLQMALQLPRLPKPDASELDTISSRIYNTVFVKPNAKGLGTSQAKSDAKHLAHAAMSGASAFVTRDGPILNARNELLEQFNIDIATVEEILDLLPAEALTSNSIPLHGEGFEPGTVDAAQLSSYLSGANVPGSIVSEFSSLAVSVRREAIRCDGHVVAVGAVYLPKGVDPVVRMIVHVRHEHRDAELFADYLLDTLTRLSCAGAPVAIELIHLAGQSIVNKLALIRGFHRGMNQPIFSKIAVGTPLLAENWSVTAQQLRRRTGLVIPGKIPDFLNCSDIEIQTPKGMSNRISAMSLEDLLGPTIIIWPGRNGVIVPINRAYADELLGTSTQANLGFIANRDAAFLSSRGYVNAPRTAKQMRVGEPIIFYESKRKGNGRGAAVAVARIASSVIVSKSQLKAQIEKRLVVDSVDGFSASSDVLMTTFDNLMIFRKPVSFATLRSFDATGGTNLVSAVSLSSEQITSILTCGWSSGTI